VTAQKKKVWYLCIQFDHLICDSETLTNHIEFSINIQKKDISAWLAFMTTVSSAYNAEHSLYFHFFIVSALRSQHSLFLMKSLRICESYLSCSLTLCNHLSNGLFLTVITGYISALSLSERDELDVTLMLSHCLNDVCSDSLWSIEENAHPEVFLEQESSKSSSAL
jgi:hypothetical protein